MTRHNAVITDISLPEFQAVLWDVDGTLVDSEPLHKQCLQMVGDEIGLPVPDDLCLRAQGVGYRFAFDTIETELGPMPISFENWLHRMTETYLTLAATSVACCEDAVKAVRHFHEKGIRQAIFSNSPRNVVEANVKGFLRGFDNPHEIFCALFSVEDVQHPKPEPDGYILAAQQLGLNPAQCLVIEDSPTGVKSGKASGAFTIFRQHANGKSLDSDSNPDLIVRSLEDLLGKHPASVRRDDGQTPQAQSLLSRCA